MENIKKQSVTIKDFLISCLFWVVLIIGSLLLANFRKKELKTEYKIELINQTENEVNIKVYSVSNDTTYTCTIDKLVEVIENDNL